MATDKSVDAKCPCGCGKTWSEAVIDLMQEHRSWDGARAKKHLASIARRMKRPVPPQEGGESDGTDNQT